MLAPIVDLDQDEELENVFWVPSQPAINTSRLATLARELNRTYGLSFRLGDYDSLHEWSISHPQEFWLSVAKLLGFRLRPFPALSKVLQRPGPISGLPALVDVTWFPTSKVNYSDVVLQYRNIEPNRTALIFYNEKCPEPVRLTFSNLANSVSLFAQALRAAGITKGDSVAGILSNTPEAVIILLATAAIGAVFASASPDFGQTALYSRLSQTASKVVFYHSEYIYKGKRHNTRDNIFGVIRRIPETSLLVEVPQPFDKSREHAYQNISFEKCRNISLRHFLEGGSQPEEFVFEDMKMSDALFTMFSSGTSGKPKCIVQGTGVLLNQMKEHAFHGEISQNSIVFFNTSTAWMMFHWLVAVLASGATIVLYDGAAFPPVNPLRLVQVCRDEHVTHFGAGAKFYQVLNDYWKKSISNELTRVNLTPIPSLLVTFSTGSPSPVENYKAVRDIFGRHIRYISMSGGTEINGSFVSGCAWKSIIAPCIQSATLGMDVQVFSQDGARVTSAIGELVCLNPSPCMPLFFSHDEDHFKYRDAYFEEFGDKVWCHRDFAKMTETGGVIISGRSDATLNPGGVRIGTADIYEIVESFDHIEDSLITESTNSKDTRIVLLLSMKQGKVLNEELRNNLKTKIRAGLSHRHVPHIILQVREIPYTFSGKKLEIAVRKILQRKPLSLDGVKNPRALQHIQKIMATNGLINDYEPLILPEQTAKL